MPPLTRITELAAIIHNGTYDIDAHLHASGQPTPSFNIDTQAAVELPDELTPIRANVLSAMDELHDLIQGPLPTLMRLASPVMNIQIALHAIYRFSIPTHIGLTETISYTVLSERSGLPETSLRRLLRAAMAHRIFREPTADTIAHTAASQLLLEMPSLLSLTGFFAEEMPAANANAVEALRKWRGSEEPSHTGFALASGKIKTDFLSEMESSEKRGKRWADTKTALQGAPEFGLGHTLDGLDWDEDYPRRTNGDEGQEKFIPNSVVLIGGGDEARAAVQMARRFEGLGEIIVQDSPKTLKGVQPPRDLGGRMMLQGVDYLADQNHEGADVYFFRGVLQEHNDKSAANIIRAQIPALKQGARIVINDVVMPETGSVGGYWEQYLRGYDLHLMSSCNGKLRSSSEWQALFEAADPNFKIVRIETPPNSVYGIIEAVWQAEDYQPPARASPNSKFVLLNTGFEKVEGLTSTADRRGLFDQSKIMPVLSARERGRWLSNSH